MPYFPAGIRAIPVWDDSYDMDANQLHCTWPVVDEYVLRAAGKTGRRWILEAWAGWVSYWMDQLVCPEGISCRIETSRPEFPLQEGRLRPSNPEVQKIFPWKDGAEIWLSFRLGKNVQLMVQIRTREASPFVRLRYSLSQGGIFAGLDGRQRIYYGGLRAEYTSLTEITFSHFDRIEHSFRPCKTDYAPEEIQGMEAGGPLILITTGKNIQLAAYEHGADTPDHFMGFIPGRDGVDLYSCKGNYFGGQKSEDYRSFWLQLGVAKAQQELMENYRAFS